MDNKPKEQESLAFEEALARLEGIVDKLEDGQATLEESLALFEDGMRLKAACQSKLERAETHVAELRKVPGPAKEAIGAFVSGQVIEPALDSIPAPVLQGFLQQLKAAL